MMIASSTVDVRVPRLRPYLGRLLYRWLDQRRLSRVEGLIPSVLRQVQPVAGAKVDQWQVLSSLLGQSGAATVLLGLSPEAPRAVLKIAFNSGGAKGMLAQRDALAALHEDDRLGGWRRLLPRMLAEGDLGALHYVLLEALPGVAAQQLTSGRGAQSLVPTVAAALRLLHERTATATIAGETLLAKEVDRPVRVLRQAVCSDLRVDREQALQSLAAELRSALAGREIGRSWIHGDLWLGNVLVGEGTRRVTGIVDWSMAAQAGLPLHDVLHLVLHARQSERGYELGDAVREVLFGGPWAPHELALLQAEDVGLPVNKAGLRAMVLLYWLNRLNSIFIQDVGHFRNRVWVGWNIDRVLRCL